MSSEKVISLLPRDDEKDGVKSEGNRGDHHQR